MPPPRASGQRRAAHGPRLAVNVRYEQVVAVRVEKWRVAELPLVHCVALQLLEHIP